MPLNDRLLLFPAPALQLRALIERWIAILQAREP